ncbi:MAG: hypothetical protein OXH77_03510 [Anaerolineaceae bacterium]|nr:hypothetical protein [Anaerolineaceae bacterium]
MDHGKDYLEYLRPFILQVILSLQPETFGEHEVADQLRSQFGLEIPARTIEIILKRISRKGLVKRSEGVYRVTGEIPDPQIIAKTSAAKRHIDSVVKGLQAFSQGSASPYNDYDSAVTAICTFLAEFDVICLNAYLRGTTIPQQDDIHGTDIIQVSKYVQHIQQTSPERFDSFLVLVQGHMLANALLCPDLKYASQTFKQVTFYLDTRLLIQLQRLEGDSKHTAMREMVSLLLELEAKVAVFSHSLRELETVVTNAATYLESPLGRGSIIREAKAKGTSRSDLQLLAESLDEKLREYGVDVIDTPKHVEKLQIDETAFEKILDEEVFYRNPGAKVNDVDSVRSIYVLRGGRSAPTLEKCRAVMVTSNEPFAKASWKFGKRHESSKDVSAVMSDFSVTNIAWLKAPVGAPDIPQSQLLAFSFAALEPSTDFLGKCMDEIDKLKERGKISERDHQLLRSSTRVIPELIHKTLGQTSRINEEAVLHSLERVSAEIRGEETEKLAEEVEAHRRTSESLAEQQQQNMTIAKKLFWQCNHQAKLISMIVSLLVVIVLVASTLFSLGVRTNDPVIGGILTACSAAFTLVSLVNFLYGLPLLDLKSKLRAKCEVWLFKRRAHSLGLDVDLGIAFFDIEN